MTDTLTVSDASRTAGRAAGSPLGTLAVVLAGQFMAVLDASVVNVAAPSIHAGLHASGAGLQLVIAGYAKALGASDKDLDVWEAQVKDYMLSQLSNVKNHEAVVDVAKELGR